MKLAASKLIQNSLSSETIGLILRASMDTECEQITKQNTSLEFQHFHLLTPQQILDVS